jgi:hypothetical protein
MAHPGYIWTVYPNSSELPMVSVGQTDDLAKAMRHVEGELARAEDAGWGLLIGPGGQNDRCRRTRDGGYDWAPLFADPRPAIPGP